MSGNFLAVPSFPKREYLLVRAVEGKTAVDAGPFNSFRLGEGYFRANTSIGTHDGGEKKSSLWPTESRAGRGCTAAPNAAGRLVHHQETRVHTLSDATCPKQVDEILHRDFPASLLFRMVSMVASDTATCACI